MGKAARSGRSESCRSKPTSTPRVGASLQRITGPPCELMSGLPKTVILSPEEVREAVDEQVAAVIDSVIACLGQARLLRRRAACDNEPAALAEQRRGSAAAGLDRDLETAQQAMALHERRKNGVSGVVNIWHQYRVTRVQCGTYRRP